jgi:hypothetical protein
MGFYVRKSLKAGPFRFSVNKSGLGAPEHSKTPAGG